MSYKFSLSVLDQSPVVSGSVYGDAIAATLELARVTDRLGYKRFWVAEHHSVLGLACASPEVLLARLTAETLRIRLGTGALLLPHYSAFKIAETFRMLETLSPGRIDLGIGRAPGGTGAVRKALESRDFERFPRQVEELIRFVAMPAIVPERDDTLYAMPIGSTFPSIWIAGSTREGAELAARLGLPFAYAHFVSGNDPSITHLYRERFDSFGHTTKPYCLIAVAAIAASSGEEAESLALPLRLWRSRAVRGHRGPIPTLDDAISADWTASGIDERQIVSGSALGVLSQLEEIAATHEAEEVQLLTITPDYSSRRRSYELLAVEFGLKGVG